MTKRMWISILVVLCVAGLAQSSKSATLTNDPVTMRVQELFAQTDALVAQRAQQSREYLASLSNEQLAELCGKTMAAQYLSPAMVERILVTNWTGNIAEIQPDIVTKLAEKIAQDRSSTITELVAKYGAPLSEQQEKDWRNEQDRIERDLAAQGPVAVPAICSNISSYNLQPNHWGMAKAALLKMGSVAIDPLLPLMKSDDSTLRDNVTDILSQLADARAKDVLLDALADESPAVRRNALLALTRLGPNVVGSERLNRLLIERLEDGVCLLYAIRGLDECGDETAIEPLRVVERFEINAYGPFARDAINAILRRAGKPEEKANPRSHTGNEPTYDELIAIATCPNAAIRSEAVFRLQKYHDERTVRFLMDRLHHETNGVLPQLVGSLAVVTLSAKEASEPGLSASIVQEAFDAIVLVAQKDAPRDADSKAAAVYAGRSMLLGARERMMKLNHVDSYKGAIHQGMSSAAESVHVACYLTCRDIAISFPERDGGWTVQERTAIVQQLTPFLNSPDPHFRLLECLAYIGDQHLAPRFIELLDHSDWVTRMFAAYALARVGGAQALPALRRVAETDPYKSTNGTYDVRMAAQSAISQIEGVQPVITLEDQERAIHNGPLD